MVIGPGSALLPFLAGVTAAGALASRARRLQDRELAEVRLVAEAAQQVLLWPVPPQAGPVRLAAGYLSASHHRHPGLRNAHRDYPADAQTAGRIRSAAEHSPHSPRRIHPRGAT